MKKIWKSFLCAMAVSLAMSGAAWAVPRLQIDVEGGLYDAVDESTYNTADTYNLYALMEESNKTDLSETYYVSMALIKPDDADWTDDFGSFSFAAVSYDDLSQFSWGTPSLLTSIELGSHGIFPSYFAEHSFSFSSGNKAKSYGLFSRICG